MVDRREYQAAWQRKFRASKHGGVRWPVGRPTKIPKVPELKCIYCTMLIFEEYHIKYPCWKSKLSMIFAEKVEDSDNDLNGVQ